MTDNEYRQYLVSCGFNEEEVEQKIKDRNTMIGLYSEKREPREITSATYERSQKALTKKVSCFLMKGAIHNG